MTIDFLLDFQIRSCTLSCYFNCFSWVYLESKISINWHEQWNIVHCNIVTMKHSLFIGIETMKIIKWPNL